jgi:hypothetical protein
MDSAVLLIHSYRPLGGSAPPAGETARRMEELKLEKTYCSVVLSDYLYFWAAPSSTAKPVHSHRFPTEQYSSQQRLMVRCQDAGAC